ncbi:MAG: anthranilate synthase component I family protein [candidate division Zixibacteria bacterium]|nr:anthranilate synthase component I family protein [candidate division Zixibacteria bacterium]
MRTFAHDKNVQESRPLELFRPLSHRPGAVWLDSSLKIGDRGSQSFIACNPTAELRVQNGCVLERRKGVLREITKGGVTQLLDYLEAIIRNSKQTALGFISYEGMLPLINLTTNQRESSFPSACFYLYDSVMSFEHRAHESSQNKTTTHSDNFCHEHGEKESIAGDPTQSPATLLAHPKWPEYERSVKLLKRHIYEGDIYQANFTAGFNIRSNTDPLTVYNRLRQLNPAPYSAYLNCGTYQILSSSPERLLKKNGTRLTSSPIKGTIERGSTLAAQESNVLTLLSSAKDRAELLMIVDLVRNDLGKFAKPGTVSVDRLYGCEIYSSLIHLVADISCELPDNVTLGQIMTALAPGGSITGTPKKRAAEILLENESEPRGVYTGAIGYISAETAEFNIAIRTLTCRNGIYTAHAGGGIVADSDAHSEYAEMMLKAKNQLLAVGATL